MHKPNVTQLLVNFFEQLIHMLFLLHKFVASNSQSGEIEPYGMHYLTSLIKISLPSMAMKKTEILKLYQSILTGASQCHFTGTFLIPKYE